MTLTPVHYRDPPELADDELDARRRWVEHPAPAFGLGGGACALAALITASRAPKLALVRRPPHLDSCQET